MANLPQPPWIIAHRGASHAVPENTLAAFQLAWEEGADGIEGDFRLTRDGHIVCIHDASTQRTADRDLRVADCTLAELRQLDVGGWKDPRYAGERIATLEQVLAIVPAGKRLFIEVKTGPEIVVPLQRVLETSSVAHELVRIIAFDPRVIQQSRETIPSVKTCLLAEFRQQESTGQWEPSVAEILAALEHTRADGFGPQANLAAIGLALPAALGRTGREFHVWTVDDPAIAQSLIALGVQSITTNRPKDLRATL